jgi:hypothetical protein
MTVQHDHLLVQVPDQVTKRIHPHAAGVGELYVVEQLLAGPAEEVDQVFRVSRSVLILAPGVTGMRDGAIASVATPSRFNKHARS